MIRQILRSTLFIFLVMETALAQAESASQNNAAGVAKMAKGEIQSAIKAFKRAIEVDPIRAIRAD